MLLSAVSVLVVAQSSSEIPEGPMNNPVYYFPVALAAQSWAMAPSILMFLDHTQRRTTVGRTPLDE